MYNRRLKLFFILMIVIGVLALFSPAPIPMPKSIPHFDKYAHFALFLFLSCASHLLLSARRPILAQLPVLTLALSTEWLQQAFLPLREFSLQDAAANLSGFLLGCTLCFFLWQQRRFEIE